MISNVLASTLRNLVRNRLYAAISVGGLAVAMAVAILTGLHVRDELTYDRFVPGYRGIHLLVEHLDLPGQRGVSAQVPPELAASLALDFPEAKDVARYGAQSRTLTRGDVEANEGVAWADPDFFALFPFKTLAGDLKGALSRPDGAVLTRSMARKYFGQDAPIGQTLMVDRRLPVRVAAVIGDLPGNSNITVGVFLSAQAPTSPYAPNAMRAFNFGRIYFRLDNPAAAGLMQRGLPAFLDRRLFAGRPRSAYEKGLSLAVIPDTDLHLLKDRYDPESMPADPRTLWGLGAIAGLILLIAGINFVNLTTARAAHRAVEVGVRKTAGAARRHLVIQFIGESVLYALAAGLAALALAELILPGLNALMQRRMTLDYAHDPMILPFTLGLVLLLGVAGGFYPAMIMSAFRPRDVLKGVLAGTTGSTAARSGLVGLQFAVLIGLALSVLVITRQTQFATTAAVGLDTDQVLRIRVDCVKPGETASRTFVDRVAALPGVAKAACSTGMAAGVGSNDRTVLTDDGRQVDADLEPAGFGFFDVYGVKPLAGRLPSPARGADQYIAPPGPLTLRAPANEVINASLARALGFARPQDAVGRSFRLQSELNGSDYQRVTVIGVVPDAQFDLTRGPPRPALYPVQPQFTGLLNVKIKAGRVPETLAAIDRLWKTLGDARPIRRQFTDAFLNTVYAAAIRQGWLIAALGAIALGIASLGLFGLAAFVAERRAKEIGVRKAMGAATPDILALLLWSFAQPVLWANLIAWPVSWWAMNAWLHGFSTHIRLEPWMFLAAGSAALFVALLTVLAHTLRVASAKPVGALRYE